MSKITLINNSQRTFHVAGFEFKPKDKKEFTEDVADRLVRLYPNEIDSLETVSKEFKEEKDVKEEKKPQADDTKAEKKDNSQEQDLAEENKETGNDIGVVTKTDEDKPKKRGRKKKNS